MKCADSLGAKQKECLGAVQKINNELHDKLGWDRHDIYLSIEICSFHYNVKLYLDRYDSIITLFNSGNSDERIYYEKSDKYESFYKFLKRKCRETLKNLNTFKI
jgi:hypothetical protein